MEKIEQLVRELSDRAAIHELLARYVVRADAQDWDAVSRCFAEQATANYGGTELGPGRQAIHDFFTSRPTNEEPRVSTHFLGNVSVDLDGDTARVESYMHVNVVDPANDDQMLMRGVRYLDDMVRAPSGWVIHRRVHELQWVMRGTLAFALQRSERAEA